VCLYNASARLAALGGRLGIWAFPLIYLGWAYLFWAPLCASSLSVWSFPNVLLFLVGGASPMLAGVTLAAVEGGKAGLYELGWRLIDVWRISLRWWVVISLFWPVFDVLVAGGAVVLGVVDRPLAIAWDKVTAPRTMAFMLLLSFVFPAVEEIGLRGYWLDKLQERFEPPVAGAINGATWAVWHTPFVWFPGYYENTSFRPELWWWLPSIVLHTLLVVWVYNGTNRSILAAILFHGMMNFTGEFLGLAPDVFPLLLVGNLVVASILVLAWSWSRRYPARAA
jgi:membrane protease YdiL (CAAX protease family)